MSCEGMRRQKVLAESRTFLRDKDLAPLDQQPHLVRSRWRILTFAHAHGGYSFEQTLDLFLSAVGQRVGTKPWQIQQMADAVRIHRYQYQRGSAD